MVPYVYIYIYIYIRVLDQLGSNLVRFMKATTFLTMSVRDIGSPLP